MKIALSACLVGVSALLGATAAAPAETMGGHQMVTPQDIKWGPVPPFLPPGAEAAVLSGDPSKAGPFTIRLRMSKGYNIPAHSHSTDEVVTVISGTVGLGMGEKAERGGVQALSAGGFVVLPAGTSHYVFSDEENVVQVNALGPLDIKYVNPQDDPQKKQAAQ